MSERLFLIDLHKNGSDGVHELDEATTTTTSMDHIVGGSGEVKMYVLYLIRNVENGFEGVHELEAFSGKGMEVQQW